MHIYSSKVFEVAHFAGALPLSAGLALFDGLCPHFDVRWLISVVAWLISVVCLPSLVLRHRMRRLNMVSTVVHTTRTMWNA